jgi:hypothetical protein
MRAIHIFALLALAASAACAHLGRPRDPDAARKAAFEAATVVFTGELYSSSVEIDSVLSNRRHAFRISRVWKGRAADTLTVWEPGGHCPLDLVVLGSEYIVYAERDATGPDVARCLRIVPVLSESGPDELGFLYRWREASAPRRRREDRSDAGSG